MAKWQGRLGVAEFATSGIDRDTSRVVAARVAVLDDDGTELAHWDWGSDRAEMIAGEVAQTLRALTAVDIPIAIFDAADGLTILDRECRRQRSAPLDDLGPVLDPLVIDQLLAPDEEGRRTLSSMAERYDVEPGSLAAGRLVLAMAARDDFDSSPAELHARQRELARDWPVVPLENVRLIQDTQPIPAPPLRPSDTVPMFDFSEGISLALEAPARAEPAAAEEPAHDEPARDEVPAHDETPTDAESSAPGEAAGRRPLRLHVSAAIVTDPAGRCLVVRRKGNSAFMQPGGKIERGESALAALIRELREGIGLEVDVDATEFLGSFEAPAANEPAATVRAEVFALATDAELTPGGEIEELHWLESPTDVDSVELAPLSRDVLLPVWAAQRSVLF